MMGRKTYFDELAIALERPNADELIKRIDIALIYYDKDEEDIPRELFRASREVYAWDCKDEEETLAYVVIAASRTDDAKFLALLGSGPLLSLLRNPSQMLLDRIIAEGRKSFRFRWLLSQPLKYFMTEQAWVGIVRLRFTGPSESASLDSLPPR